MLVAQAPGEQENQAGTMFIGPSGTVLDDLLDYAGVPREDIYMTNLVKCMLPDYRKPKQDEIDSCSKFLDAELAIVDPDVVVPLGHYATRYILTMYHDDVPSQNQFSNVYGTLHVQNGTKIYPLRHPAAQLYHHALEPIMKHHYRKLGVLQQPCSWYPSCPMKRFYEQGHLDREWIERYCRGDWESCIRYQLEEQGKPHPDSMLPNGDIDPVLKELVA